MSIHLSLRPTVLWLSGCGKTVLIQSLNPIKVERKQGPCFSSIVSQELVAC